MKEIEGQDETWKLSISLLRNKNMWKEREYNIQPRGERERQANSL